MVVADDETGEVHASDQQNQQHERRSGQGRREVLAGREGSAAPVGDVRGEPGAPDSRPAT
jgi:hypothetical protein